MKREASSRNMSRYPIVRKDYDFPANLALRVRYNKQALVNSGLLAGSAAFFRASAALWPKDRHQ